MGIPIESLYLERLKEHRFGKMAETFDVLDAMDNRTYRPVTLIMDITDLDRETVCKKCKTLERFGLVRKGPPPGEFYILTQKGLDFFDSIPVAYA